MRAEAAHFCSMRSSRHLRTQTTADEVAVGLRAKVEAFTASGGAISLTPQVQG